MSRLPYYYTLVLVTESQEWPCNFLSRQSNQMSLSRESTMQFLFDSCISQGNSDYASGQKIKDSNILNLIEIHILDNVSSRIFRRGSLFWLQFDPFTTSSCPLGSDWYFFTFFPPKRMAWQKKPEAEIDRDLSVLSNKLCVTWVSPVFLLSGTKLMHDKNMQLELPTSSEITEKMARKRKKRPLSGHKKKE